MQRRSFLAALPAIAAALTVRTAEAAPAQDVEYIRAWERAQQLRPRTLTSQARIAPAGEPGTPLTIAGRLFDRDGRSPMRGITIFAYHTDGQGHYDVPANGPHSWRLKGWALTDENGRFRFDTIRPAPYPGRNVAAHVHVSLEGPHLRRRSAGLQFDDDPLVTREDRERSDKAGRFGDVLHVLKEGTGQRVDYQIRVSDEGIF
jgi:protocatechuate 3,4-dioxygenase beta subunit